MVYVCSDTPSGDPGLNVSTNSYARYPLSAHECTAAFIFVVCPLFACVEIGLGV